jgi:hypothetical protein
VNQESQQSIVCGILYFVVTFLHTNFWQTAYVLKRVILGVRCEAKREVEQALAEGGLADVEIIQARMSDTSYEVLCD